MHTYIHTHACTYGICLLFIFVQVMISLAAQLHYSYAACDVTVCVCVCLWLAKFMNECGESNESGEISACNYAIEEAAAEPATAAEAAAEECAADKDEEEEFSPQCKTFDLQLECKKNQMYNGTGREGDNREWTVGTTYDTLRAQWALGTVECQASTRKIDE